MIRRKNNGGGGDGGSANDRRETSARGCVKNRRYEPAFDETLAARYGAEIYRFALHLTRNRTDADDLYQETALKAYRAWDRLPCDANHRAWLYRIASNTFLSDKRKTSRLLPLDVEQTVEAFRPQARTTTDVSTLEIFAPRSGAAEALPPSNGALVQQYLDIGYSEIASTLGCSEAARRSVHEH